MPFTTVDAPWAMFGRCRDFAFIGNRAIATVSGIHGRFLDLRSGQTRVERFEGSERGDGASCVAGLAVAPVFSLVERRANPRISVFAYPTMRRISRCAESREAHGYLCCAFAGTEYLLGQTTFPDYRLVLWCWRTGERLTSIQATTTVDVDRTTLACSIESGRLVARHSAISGTVLIYRVLVCSDLVRLFPLEVDSRKAASVSWSRDGSLLGCDEFGKLWSVEFVEDGTHRVRTLVEREENERSKPTLLAHRDGALVIDRSAGDVRATFYRKASKDRDANWRAAWTAPLPCYPNHAMSDPREERILLLGESGDLYEITRGSIDKPLRIKLLLRNLADFLIVAPLFGHCFAALDRSDRLLVLDGSTGDLVSSTARLTHHGKVVRLTRHPVLPILATCSDSGNCVLVEGTTSSSLKVLSCVHLQKEPLDRIKFSQKGEVLGVGTSQLGRVFVLSSSPKFDRPSVASWLNLERKLVDFLICETDGDHELRILVLIEGSDDRVGKEIAVYACKLFDEYPKKAEHTMKLSSPFETLCQGIATSLEIFGVPRFSKQLHRIEPLPLPSQHNSDAITLDVLPSLHQMGNIKITVHQEESSNRGQLITCGYDGLIVLRDCAAPRRVFAVFPAHHRAEGGGRCAILVGDAIVSLGRNGDLVASKLPPSIANRVVEGSKSVTVDRISSSVKKTTTEASWESYLEVGTWMEATNRDRSMAQEKLTLSSRLSILNDLNELKSRVKQLLDSNEKQPPHAQLPISAFDLDQEARERKLAAARAERESLVEEAELITARQDRATSYLRERFLEPLLDPPRSISSVLGRTKVSNYPVLKIDSQRKNLRAWSRFSMETRRLVSRLEENEENRGYSFDSCMDRGFVEVVEANVDAEERERELKIRFNDRLETLREVRREKRRTARKLANETRRCVDELKQTFCLNASAESIDVSRWDKLETSDETSSDSSDQPEAVVEERSLSEEADFRREALDRMMEGLLEFGLEDSAKRSVPRPDCLVREDPSSYTEEDVRAIESYEKKLAVKWAAREKYKSTLQAEIVRAKDEFCSDAKAFDEQLHELSLEKIRVERAVLLERLSKVQRILGHRRVVQARREIRRVNDVDLTSATNRARKIVEERELFETSIVELKNRYESVRKRDKFLEDKFRAELVESKRSALEHLLREYRRRPRNSITRFASSVVFLSELSSCLTEERATSDILPTEWLEYLRAVDRMDATPDAFHQDPQQWRAVCRLRRVKLEAEIKVKSCAIELAEAEHSVAFLRNACLVARATIERRKQEIRDLEDVSLNLTEDREVWLLLKTGQLDQQPEGCLRADWLDAVLVPRAELVRANEAIVAAGQQKLLAIRQLANIRRTVSVEEWRHARAKATMAELQERVKDLEAVKVSRVARECREHQRNEMTPKQPVPIVEKKAPLVRETLEKYLETETRNWRRRNATLAQKLERSKAERDELVAIYDDPLRSRNVSFQRTKMRAIARKTKLARRIRANFAELLTLERRLEAFKLSAYPTLGTKL